MKFTEAKLEQVFIELLSAGEMKYFSGEKVKNTEAVLAEPKGSYAIKDSEVLIKSDLKAFLRNQYKIDGITENEVNFIIRDLEKLPASDLYESNKVIMKKVADGFLLKREDIKAELKVDLIILLAENSSLLRNPLSFLINFVLKSENGSF